MVVLVLRMVLRLRDLSAVSDPRGGVPPAQAVGPTGPTCNGVLLLG